MPPAILALAALAVIAACAPTPDSGLAGCFEDMGGRYAYRPGWEPTSRGLCPTRTEMLANSAMDARFSEAGCGPRCKLSLLLLKAR